MKHVITTVIVILIITTHSEINARIGETPAEFAERYGQSIKKSPDDHFLYSKSGFLIFAFFHEGKADAVGFRKVEENALGKGVEISDNEIEIILKSNSGGRDWKERQIISMDREWHTEEADLLATYTTFENLLMIFTKEYVAREQAAKDAKEGQKLEGF